MRLQHATGAVRLKPGDRVLLTFDRMPSMAELDRIVKPISEKFPDVEFVFVAGASALVIPSGERSSNDQA